MDFDSNVGGNWKTAQLRYVFGPLVKSASRLLAQIVRLQDQMELPMGLVMKEAGAKFPDSHLIDPISAIWRMKIAKHTLPTL